MIVSDHGLVLRSLYVNEEYRYCCSSFVEFFEKRKKKLLQCYFIRNLLQLQGIIDSAGDVPGTLCILLVSLRSDSLQSPVITIGSHRDTFKGLEKE